MVKSARVSYLLGVAALWPPLYGAAFLVGVLALVASGGPRTTGDGPPPWFVVVFALQALTVLLSLALMVIYLVDVVHNPALSDKADQRIMWILLLVLAGVVAAPVYWWLHLRPGSESFQSRPPAAPPVR